MGFIHWDGNRYSVPYEHVTALLAVRITQNELYVYGPGLACIAHHQLLARGTGGDSVLAAHRPPRLDSPGASLEIIREHFLALGEAAGGPSPMPTSATSTASAAPSNTVR